MEHRISYVGENFAIGSFVASAMRSAKEDDPNRTVRNTLVSLFNACLEQSLEHGMSEMTEADSEILYTPV